MYKTKWNKVYRPLRRLVELGFVLLGYVVIPLLPRSIVVCLANSIGKIAYCIPSKTRSVGLANLDVAFGHQKTHDEKTQTLQKSFQTFTRVVLDLFWFSFRPTKRIPHYVQFDPDFNEMLKHSPQICTTAHFGNWEIMGQAISIAGFEIANVAAPIKNKWVDHLFRKIRAKSGQAIIPRKGALRNMLRKVKDGSNVGIMLDQNTLPMDGGVFVDFFGLPVPVSQAGAFLASRAKVDIIFCFCLPEPDGSYRVISAPPIQIDEWFNESKKADLPEITQAIIQGVEEVIRKYPEHWLWSYKRWGSIPNDYPPSRFPNYANPIDL
ncbi:MAG: hypothetical protein GKR87_11760 [Kiritimatiellae bacterium]|nr:hypothetical protein [Kiritimatiellia bacterium]